MTAAEAKARIPAERLPWVADMIRFCRRHGQPCFIHWPDNFLGEYLLFHAEHRQLVVVRDPISHTFPEAAQTLQTQLNWLKDGRRQIMLVTPGETCPIPDDFHTVTTRAGTFAWVPGAFKASDLRQAVIEDRIGQVLGYGIPAKPAPGTELGSLTLRGPDGVEKLAIATDAAHHAAVNSVLLGLQDPGDTITLEPIDHVLFGRVLAGAEPPAIRAIGIGWQCSERDIEKHWVVSDPSGDSYYMAHAIARDPASRRLLWFAWEKHLPHWSTLKLFARRRKQLKRYSPRDLQRLSHE